SPIDAGASHVRKALMEIIVALGIAVLAGSGVWLILRPRTFQVIVGLSLLSYAVNLFIFVMGWVRGGAAPFVPTEGAPDPASFALARWHRAGPQCHSLFQFLLAGLSGAVLTGDLFNLFVFFELLLAASYGLALHGSGTPRVRASLHYIVMNLTASLLFLVGVS